MKRYLRLLYLSTYQIRALARLSRGCARVPLIGRGLSVAIDNLMLSLYGIEMTSTSLDVSDLVVGHSTGVVLGGNGIRCTGRLHISSGVCFARRYGDGPDELRDGPFFDIEGDLTVGANAVLLGPLKIKGPTVIGALTLVSKDIDEPGVYVGTPARRIADR